MKYKLKNYLLVFSYSILLSLSLIFLAYAKENSYVSKQFIHLHKNSSVNSIVLVTLSCGQKVDVISKENEWLKVKSGSFEGFVLERNFQNTQPRCFNNIHTKLYNKLDLNMREVYKLGRLEDLFIYGEPSL